MSLYWPTHLTRLTAGDGYRTCDLSATASSTISPALNWTRPVPESAPQPGLIGIPAVKEAFIILLSSGLIFPLPPSHIIINTLWWGHCYTHTHTHIHSRADKQHRGYSECMSGRLRRRQTAQMLQRQDTQRATVISMPAPCAAVLICSPCLEKEFCLVSLALGSALCRESSPPSLPLSLLHFLCFSAFQLDFFLSRLYRKIHDVTGRERTLPKPAQSDG